MLREKGESVRIDMYNGQVTAATNLSLAIEDKFKKEENAYFWNLEGDMCPFLQIRWKHRRKDLRGVALRRPSQRLSPSQAVHRCSASCPSLFSFQQINNLRQLGITAPSPVIIQLL